MKLLSLLALFCLAPFATAHVLLTTPYSVTGPLGVTTCSATHATMTNAVPSYGSTGALSTVTVTYSLGTATFSGGLDTGFTVAACAPTYTYQLNMVSGAWTLTLNGTGQVAAGTFTAPVLAQAVINYGSAATAFRDDADQFLTVSGAGLLAAPLGTQPATWANGDN